ncbi:helix-turn-helix transcriptional regulator [Phytomonospora sp. NPDC050363]|uniref:helix-turn-helix transcriptional regulator n=1 Tax=Phytomonospora sp. NPDC050363 TaxID=3155642 RepID=UPI0033CB22E9
MDRTELATVLRTARARLTPAEVGLPLRTRRQVPGLRREEVARLAGVSVEYVVRLEQARAPKPSDQVLGALSRALRLGDDDRELLYRLAGTQPPAAGRVSMTVRPSVRRLLDRMVDTPAVILSAKSDILAWNPPATMILGDLGALSTRDRNLARNRFLAEKPIPVTLTRAEDDASAAHCVGCLRAAHARYPGDPDLIALITELRAESPRFEELWLAGRGGQHRPATATIDHPRFGRLALDCDVLTVPEADQSVLVYSAAPGTAAAAVLEGLRHG